MIFVDDIGQSHTADWPEPAHGVADRQQGIRVDAGWQSECGLRFLLELQIERRQCRAEAERSRRQQHVLHRWVMDEPDVRVGVPPSRQGTIHTGAS